MIKITIIENGKNIDKIVDISTNGLSNNKFNEMNRTLTSLGLKEVPLNEISKTENVNKQESDICCICQDSFQIGSIKRTLQCNHFFHDSCIEKWLTTRIKCPLCARDIA